MKITEIIKIALRKAIDDAGSQTNFSQKTGVSDQNISRYLSGKTKEMEYDSFVKIYAEIIKYLPDNFAMESLYEVYGERIRRKEVLRHLTNSFFEMAIDLAVSSKFIPQDMPPETINRLRKYVSIGMPKSTEEQILNDEKIPSQVKVEILKLLKNSV